MGNKKTKNPPQKRIQKSRFKQLLTVSVIIFISFLATYFVTQNSIEPKAEEVSTEVNDTKVYTPDPRPKYWFYMARGYMWIFFSVDNVLRKLGLEKIEVNVESSAVVHNNWDLLWTYGEVEHFTLTLFLISKS